MFRVETRQTKLNSSFRILELIFHSAVRSIRQGHSHALIGLIYNMVQTAILLLVFYVMYQLLGMRANSVRGDFIVYLMSGIFLYMTNIKSMGAVVGSEGPTSAMMLHAPMNTAIAISSAALGALYNQLLSILIVLGVYHIAWSPVTIDNPIGVLGMVILAWANGVSVGMVILALKPWSPGGAGLAQAIYSRANMFASGKMFVANSLSYSTLQIFDWNPLFHIIDQARGFAFINYHPHNSNVMYAIYVTTALFVIGLMGEFNARKHASMSWYAGR